MPLKLLLPFLWWNPWQCGFCGSWSNNIIWDSTTPKMMVGRLLDKVKSTEHWNVFVTDSHSQDSLSFFLAGPYGKGVEFLEVGLETAV
jgi:hypothetical protein